MASTSAPAKRTRKKRESWGSVIKLKSGNYRASYIGPDGDRHAAPTTFRAMADARGWLASVRVSIDRDQWDEHTTAATENARRSHDTLLDFTEAWLESRTNSKGEPLRPSTKAEYERLVRGPLAPLMAKRITRVTASDVRDWYAEGIAKGRRTQTSRAYGLLKAVMATAVEDRKIVENPCRVRGAMSASTGRKVEPPTRQELAVMVDTIPERFQTMLLLAAWGGLRYGELTELRRGDVSVVRYLRGDVVEVIVNVTRGVTRADGGYIVGSPKSAAGVRAVVLPPFVWAPVLQHLSERTGLGADSLLFPAADGMNHLAPSAFYSPHWYTARRAAGREDMPFHALRHFAGTQYAQSGATLKETMARLGHSSPGAAMRYQHAGSRDSELARRMGV